jgi:glycolate dehydrogenase iron-sulfur subunit
LQDKPSTSRLTATLLAEEEKLLACIHCGLCLEACPTYVATGDENDGPRGRIYLMRAVEEGRLATNSTSFERHIDRCLGCRACEAVCPAGVEYGQLLEAGRAEIFHSTERRGVTYKLLRLALRHIWLHPARLRFAFACGRIARDAGLVRLLLKSKLPRLVSRRFEFALALLASSSPAMTVAKRADDSSTTREDQETSVLLFKGCVTEGLFARVNQSTARVLEVNGFSVRAPNDQVCCGALHAHAGDLEGARKLARKNVEAFNDESRAPIITNAGGCGAMLVSYAHLFADDERFAEPAREFSARVRDISQQLQTSELKEGAPLGELGTTYDASCHLIYGQHAGDAPLQMLSAIPDLEFVPLEGSERCCGGAGVYNLVEPELSRAVLEEKLSHIKQTGAHVLATGNPGCQMQIGAGAQLSGTPLRVCHPVELLDESYRRAGFYERSTQQSVISNQPSAVSSK